MIAANAILVSDRSVDFSDHGIHRVETAQAGDFLSQATPSVLAAHCRPGNYREIISLLLSEKRRNRNIQLIVIQDELATKELIDIHNQIHPSLVISYEQLDELPKHFEFCFRQYYEKEQRRQMATLVSDKNDELKRLTASLEEKVNERQEKLNKTKEKNLFATKRLELLKKTMLQIYSASSLKEIEHGITEALKAEFEMVSVSVRRPGQSNLKDQLKNLKHYKVTLKIGQKDQGDLLFISGADKNFSAQDKRFLQQVADAVSLSIERSLQLQRSQELKKQWEATFDAIADPICLIDESYNIKRINQAFLKKTGGNHYKEQLGKKCYSVLFNRDEPCKGCQIGKNFQIRNPRNQRQSEVFDVYSHNLSTDQSPLYFQMYRDVTNDLNLQRQVIETAKMAELGTISSSIAHELNNPIGGMLNFVQLIKMDLEGDEEYYPDILEIEKGITKCKDIVRNLLGFARQSFQADVADVSLNEVVDQAIKITELKTRSIGIKINLTMPENELFVMGRYNLLTHAVRNILQNAQESLIDERRKDRNFQGVITVALIENKNTYEIQITDNGQGVSPDLYDKIFDPLYTTKDPETNSGLGLTLALQIVEEHRGTIKVSADKDKNICFHLRFSKPESQSGASVF